MSEETYTLTVKFSRFEQASSEWWRAMKLRDSFLSATLDPSTARLASQQRERPAVNGPAGEHDREGAA